MSRLSKLSIDSLGGWQRGGSARGWGGWKGGGGGEMVTIARYTASGIYSARSCTVIKHGLREWAAASISTPVFRETEIQTERHEEKRERRARGTGGQRSPTSVHLSLRVTEHCLIVLEIYTGPIYCSTTLGCCWLLSFPSIHRWPRAPSCHTHPGAIFQPEKIIYFTDGIKMVI